MSSHIMYHNHFHLVTLETAAPTQILTVCNTAAAARRPTHWMPNNTPFWWLIIFKLSASLPAIRIPGGDVGLLRASSQELLQNRSPGNRPLQRSQLVPRFPDLFYIITINAARCMCMGL